MDKPKLLPLEYCKLDRAARMLGCEVEDLIHWGAIKAIDLRLYIDKYPCVIQDQRNDDEIKLSSIGSIDSIYLNGGLASYWSLKKMVYETTGERYVRLLKQIGPGKFVTEESEDPVVEYEVTHCGGFWAVPYGVPMSMEKANDGRYQLYGRLVLYCYEGKDTICAHVFFHDEDLYLTASDLWIAREDIKKLHKALSEDDPMLPNIFNSAEIAAQARKEEQERGDVLEQERPKTRISNPHAKLTVALMRSMYSDAELSQPYKLHGVMGAGLPGYPIEDGKTLKEILKKGGWDNFEKE